MSEDRPYRGAETTGFQSPAQDHIEDAIDLRHVLDLDKPSVYPVVVDGDGLKDRGILDGDILITNRALDPSPGRVAVAYVHGDVVTATLRQDGDRWLLALADGSIHPIDIDADVEVFSLAVSLVRRKL